MGIRNRLTDWLTSLNVNCFSLSYMRGTTNISSSSSLFSETYDRLNSNINTPFLH